MALTSTDADVIFFHLIEMKFIIKMEFHLNFDDGISRAAENDLSPS